jgi:hypothetical protein
MIESDELLNAETERDLLRAENQKLKELLSALGVEIIYMRESEATDD